ncbi:MAG: NADH-quinone oxidoreductase subunit D [Palaeococcus sp.]|uniref:NADH-quinone oxidoreductase subunit D n=1 Tax=Palaeococcus sp. (in: euryarchaeotes) TaxID=2820298 RepID=UPI0025E1BF18|nr:NADH-quinone oxidoreductase subunit D [Palaeococcus sp. (in: euryarchaeotes)]MCD6558728.1 NADH-quinone oxidoreductase subunit D [Palaeococcus sp. (in: euryarchaeotes)]
MEKVEVPRELKEEAKAHDMYLYPIEKDTYELFFGPQHMATENFSIILKMDGSRVEKAIVNPGFLHRGFEKLAEQRPYFTNIALLLRICVPESDVPENIYSMAVDELVGWEVPERAQWIRTVVLEMARLSAWMFWIFGFGNELGLYTAGQWAVAYRERFMRLFEELTGGRVYHIYTIPGGVRRDIPGDKWLRQLRDTVEYIKAKMKDFDEILFDNYIVFERTEGVGVMDKKFALDHAVTGPNLRAVGIGYDVRKDDPYLFYPEVEFEVPILKEGDSLARALVRRYEIEQDLYILEQLLERGPPSGPYKVQDARLKALPRFKVPKGDAYAHVESTKGDFGAYVVSDGSHKPYRVHIRGPSQSHGVTVLENLLVGARLADVPVILKTLDNCPPDIDR